jgi:ATP-dependent RNA circularization protein (DNA/RNA ligase family)
LPGSRMGPADHHCHEGQARICTEKPRDKHDFIVVQEKLDGSCVSVAHVNGEIVALGRAGYLAATSPYEQHRMFAQWVFENGVRFADMLCDGERAVGEWLGPGSRHPLRIEA